MKNQTLDIFSFLKGETPPEWAAEAVLQLPLILIDHAHCEKKAASTAIGLIYRYPDKSALLKKMSRLAREELLHFDQVLKILEKRCIIFENISPCGYAQKMHDFVKTHEPNKLIDTLIVGAFIEARSCERFQKLSEVVDAELAHFYKKLYAAEARHFLDYLSLAQHYSQEDITERINFFAEIEYQLITADDPIFRFHSGRPIEHSTYINESFYSTTSSEELISSNSEPSLIESPVV